MKYEPIANTHLLLNLAVLKDLPTKWSKLDTHHHSCHRLTVSQQASGSAMLTTDDDQAPVMISRSLTEHTEYFPTVTKIIIDQTRTNGKYTHYSESAQDFHVPTFDEPDSLLTFSKKYIYIYIY